MRLAKRERYAIIIMVCMGFLVLTMELFIFPMLELKKDLSRSVLLKEKELIELSGIIKEYKALISNIDVLKNEVSKRGQGFSLFSYLDNVSKDVNIKDNVKYMKPSDLKSAGAFKERLVEMEIDNITLDQFIEFLYKIEYKDLGISVKRLSIKRKENKKGILNVILQVSTFE